MVHLTAISIHSHTIPMARRVSPITFSFPGSSATMNKLHARCHFAQMSRQQTQNSLPASHSAPPNSDSDSGFKILKEELCYSRYLNVYNRIVEYPPREEVATESSGCKGKIVQYDIVGSKTVSFHFCAVFPYDTLTRSVTLIKEYAQGGNCYMYGVPCGGLSEKHLSLEDCARKELSEEAQLQGGNLVKLIPDDHPGLLEVKWCRNRFTPFVLLDPEKDATPCPMDPEEVIEVLTVDILTLKEIIRRTNIIHIVQTSMRKSINLVNDIGLIFAVGKAVFSGNCFCVAC